MIMHRKWLDGLWYDSIAATDKAVINELAEWVRPIQWQLFVTLTFPWDVKSETADSKFAKFMDQLERSLKTRVGFLAGKEGRSKNGLAVPFHFHVLMTASEPISAERVESLWKRLVRRSHSVSPEDDSVLVKPYEANMGGVYYVVKMIASHDADWNFKWLDFFNPTMSPKYNLNHRPERQQRRWQEHLDRASRA